MSAFIFGGDADKAMKIMEAGQWNNQANQLEVRGDFAGAESLFLRSLARKIEVIGEDSIQIALAKNTLGELYLKMEGKLDDAQKLLEDADRVRSVSTQQHERQVKAGRPQELCTWYCSETCQKVDWKTRHKRWCTEPTAESVQGTSVRQLRGEVMSWFGGA
ncbi:putative tetratricopeptide repeat family protein [Botrytis fragariae]|uniref:Putative tetratricopeptide repeat family protein n=1 Tax=Botrytis fragariae TaxID=1964551 RepID=A0A8H6AT42_9HELO|nr:putative tetratricopeptide repeat family protein [Botrytis fragariae]KAF5873096.1 putative tetratricopeptide repeat family protein [Botrytis fragariae]